LGYEFRHSAVDDGLSLGSRARSLGGKGRALRVEAIDLRALLREPLLGLNFVEVLGILVGVAHELGDSDLLRSHPIDQLGHRVRRDGACEQRRVRLTRSFFDLLSDAHFPLTAQEREPRHVTQVGIQRIFVTRAQATSVTCPTPRLC